MRQPKWTRGAYATSPRLRDVKGANTVEAHANVESWRGTPEELLNCLQSLLSVGDGEGQQQITLTWCDGRQSYFDKVPTAVSALEADGMPLDDLILLRAEGQLDDKSLKWTFVAKNQPSPGVFLNLEGSATALVRGAAEQAFQDMMIGYVDRLGTWRAPVWLLTSLAPVLLASFAVSATGASSIVRLATFAAAILSATAVALVTSTQFQVTPGLTLVRTSELRGTRRNRDLWQNLIARRWVRAIGASLWALGLGVLGNKLAGLLNWP